MEGKTNGPKNPLGVIADKLQNMLKRKDAASRAFIISTTSEPRLKLAGGTEADASAYEKEQETLRRIAECYATIKRTITKNDSSRSAPHAPRVAYEATLHGADGVLVGHSAPMNDLRKDVTGGVTPHTINFFTISGGGVIGVDFTAGRNQKNLKGRHDFFCIKARSLDELKKFLQEDSFGGVWSIVDPVEIKREYYFE